MELINNLKNIIKDNWDTITNDFNKHIDEKFEEFFFMSYSEYFKNNKTQEITKIISPVFNAILCKNLKPFGFNKCESDGSDYTFENILIEGKITLSKDNSWTGNGYKKTNWHLLVKLELDEYGMIRYSFCALVPLDECVSNWTKPTLGSNFSSLKFENQDYQKINIINGMIERKTSLLSIILL
jgi:hypothetical protein